MIYIRFMQRHFNILFIINQEKETQKIEKQEKIFFHPILVGMSVI